MKKYTIKNYKGNLLESVQKFQAKHKDMRIVEAFEQDDLLRLSAEPIQDPTPVPETPEKMAGGRSDVADSQGIDANDPIIDFGCRLLFFSVLVHLWHLNCTVNSQHLALKELYEACDDIGDRLLEASIGQTGVPATFVGTEDMDPAYTEASIGKIIGIKNEAAALIGAGDAGFDNILGEFCETCNSIIYKLKRLT